MEENVEGRLSEIGKAMLGAESRKSNARKISNVNQLRSRRVKLYHHLLSPLDDRHVRKINARHLIDDCRPPVLCF